MAKHYMGGNRDQQFLMATNMRDWLEASHLAWFVIEVVAKVNTAAFHARHRYGPGRPAYDPDMMLTLLYYAYVTGLRSSRRIEAACRTDAAFRVIAGNAVPDHATIARFLVEHQDAIEDTFVDVLRLCAAAGLVSVGTVAIDGTKMAADAAIDKNRGAEWIRDEVARIVAEAAATDAAEDGEGALFGLDELPAGLSTPAGRLAVLNAALAHIEAQDAAARTGTDNAAAKAHQAAAEGRKVRGNKPTKDPHAALARAEADHVVAVARAQARSAAVAAKAQAAAAAGRKPTGRAPAPDGEHILDQRVTRCAAALQAARLAVASYTPAATVANVTDPDSRIMKATTGFVQGYNCQAAVDANQIVVACAVTQEVTDVRQYQPMVAATQTSLDAAGITETIGVVLADAGYWSDENATTDGPECLIAPLKDWKQRRVARELGNTTGPPPPQASTIEAMEHRLRTPQGAANYAKRSTTVEPVFADDKCNRGYRTFRRRGLRAVSSEWSLINTTHNLAKLFRHHTTTRLAPT